MAALGGTQVVFPIATLMPISERTGFWAMPENTKAIGTAQKPFVELLYVNPVPTAGQVWPRNS